MKKAKCECARSMSYEAARTGVVAKVDVPIIRAVQNFHIPYLLLEKLHNGQASQPFGKSCVH